MKIDKGQELHANLWCFTMLKYIQINGDKWLMYLHALINR